MSGVDPSTWQSLKTDTPKGRQIFMSQLVQYLRESFSPNSLARTLSGSTQGIIGGALKGFSVNIASGGGTQTLDTRNSYAVHVSWEMTGAGPMVLVLENLLVGAPVSIQITNGAGGGRNFSINATNSAGTAYTIFAKGASYIDMVNTGISVTNGATHVFSGNSSLKGSTPDLELVYN